MSDRPDHAVAVGVASKLSSGRAYLLHQVAESRARTPLMSHSLDAQRRQLDALHTLGLLAEPSTRAKLTPLGEAVHAIWLGRNR